MSARLAVSTGLLAALAAAVASCGGDESGPVGQVSGGTLTIYSSLPLQGPTRPRATAMVEGMRLALKEAERKAGDFKVQYESLDDSTAAAGRWTPEQTQINAQRAAKDPTTIAYIGDFDSGATAVSLPILNEEGIPQVSPASTAVGLTTGEEGADKGEPEKHYPTGERTFVRIVPRDTVQGRALASLLEEERCDSAYIASDQGFYGAALARNIHAAVSERGIEVAGVEGIDPGSDDHASLAARIRRERADCFVYSGTTASNAVRLFDDVADAAPRAKLFGPDGVADSSFADPGEGGLSREAGDRTLVTAPTLAEDSYPPDGQKFFSDYTDEFGDSRPNPYAILGYEAMRLTLDAIERAGERGNDREAVLGRLFSTRGRKSVLGTYDIDQNGDTSLTDYGVYEIADGELVFRGQVELDQQAGRRKGD